MIPPILMPTAPKYARLADWTRGQISRFWPDHPEIFVCGLPNDGLPLQDDPGDWMRVVRSACADLRAHGLAQAYIILDDHPPIARCNGEFLKNTLPRMALELKATCILTGGFGPLIARKAEIIEWETWRVECLPLAAPFKLGLHPALWDLGRLESILEILIERLPQEQHTPWAFERIGSNAQSSGLPPEWLSSCWRLDAMQASAPAAAALHAFPDRLQQYARRLGYLFGRALGRPETPDPLRHPRVGPYPCFWSGVMKKGLPNQEYFAYAAIRRRPELTRGLNEAFAACG
jgi:hypothetical protein